jgi:Zn-finger in Ran binding protein and others
LLIADSADSGAAPTASAVPLSELFKKASDTWDCTVCYVTNKNSDAKCLACTAARPASVAVSATKTAVAASPAKSPHVTRGAATQIAVRLLCCMKLAFKIPDISFEYFCISR